MLDIKFVREHIDLVKEAVKNKKLAGVINVDDVIKADDEYKTLLIRVEEHRALRNSLSEAISKAEKSKREDLILEATTVKEELQKQEEELANLELARNILLKKLPNLISEDTPVGKDDSENQVIRTHGNLPKFDFEPVDHMTLGTRLGIIDAETAAKVTGSGFAYLLGEAARIQFALVQLTLDALTDHKIVAKLAKQVGNPNESPFVPVVPPVMVREEVMDMMDRLHPKDERYVLDKDGVVLVGSAEHTMGPMLMGALLDPKDLPKRFIGYSTAFRREAGSYGKDTKGIIRVHQFDKLEMETFSLPENGLAEQELMVAVQEYLLQQLEIPYQVMAVCTGDMGKPDYRQIDINSWMPGQSKYRETHTSDYMTDYQSRRLDIRVKGGDYVYMNDATALAIGRVLIALLENHQQKDGSVKMPKALHKYLGFKEIKPK